MSSELDVLHSLKAELPHGVSAQLRTDGKQRYVFVMNFNVEPTSLDLGAATYTDLLTGDTLSGAVELAMYDVKVLTEMALATRLQRSAGKGVGRTEVGSRHDSEAYSLLPTPSYSC